MITTFRGTLDTFTVAKVTGPLRDGMYPVTIIYRFESDGRWVIRKSYFEQELVEGSDGYVSFYEPCPPDEWMTTIKELLEELGEVPTEEDKL